MIRTFITAAALIGLGIAVVRQQRRLNSLRSTMSQQFNDLDAAIAANDQAQTEALTRVTEDVAELKRRADEGAPAEDLRPLIDRVQASTARLQGVDPDPSFPAPSAEPEPEPAPPAEAAPPASGNGSF